MDWTSSTQPISRVLVTGASRGLGLAVINSLLHQGIEVIAAVRRPRDAMSLAAYDPAHLTTITLDLASEESIALAAAEVSTRCADRGLQGIVHAASRLELGPLELIDARMSRQLFEVNLLGPLDLTRRLLPTLRHGNGRVITLGASPYRAGAPLGGLYGATMAALSTLASSLQDELAASGLHGAHIVVGAVQGAMRQRALARWQQTELEADPLVSYRYAASTAQLQTLVDLVDQRAVDQKFVVDTVLHALLNPQPLPRYTVAHEPDLLSLLSSRLGGAMAPRQPSHGATDEAVTAGIAPNKRPG